ncbi:MAG: DUF2971 domain-containing protein [Cupriavidus sp.]|uniref:DUF2971 domain-containing protein n=1 Tax=Cupriavidus pauculus TaxID=82633 RepID=UPI0004BA3152|nr:DUF2971 domain-containing protein [Cupriavidus pauculus]MBU67015.1 DUF2971 domain-containing protein [Cupriavidus sp.]MBU68999.1 DUF2971 domain-containing protein [Cupriavidus sp.]
MELITPPASLFKLYALSADVQWVRFERLLSHGEIYLAKPSEFNDPFDCAPSFAPGAILDRKTVLQLHNHAGRRRGHSRPERRLRARRFMAQPTGLKIAKYNAIGLQHVQNVGVFCMTDRRDHPLMWSHYGDKHTGVCIEFASNMGPFQLAHKVSYAKNLPVYDLRRNDIDGFASMYLTKADFWAYESEYRLIALNVDNSERLDLLKGFEDDHDLLSFVIRRETHGVHRLSTRLIRSITFGCACPVDTVRRVMALAQSHGVSVPFCRAQKKADRFELVFSPVAP